MSKFSSFSGRVTKISNYNSGIEGTIGCFKFITVQNKDEEIVNFIMVPFTYLVEYDTIEVGDYVQAFYYSLGLTITIYPPQYEAVVISKIKPNINVTVDYFDNNLINSDNTLKLNIGPGTEVIMQNGQNFTESCANKNLVVLYGPTTKSIPAQTSPYKVVVLCLMK